MTTKTYTAICKDMAKDTGSHWICAVDGATPAEAAAAAIAQCAADWEYDETDVALLGLIAGDVHVVAWADAGVAADELLDSDTIRDFIDAMPEITSVQERPLGEWIMAQVSDCHPGAGLVARDDLDAVLCALGDGDVTVDISHSHWGSPHRKGLTPREHLRNSWRSFCKAGA